MLINRCYIFASILLSLWISACAPEIPDEIAIELKNLNIEPDYNFHVKPILSDKCFACHGPDKMKQKAGLRLDIAKNAYASLPESPDKVAITPGNLRKSEFLQFSQMFLTYFRCEKMQCCPRWASRLPSLLGLQIR